MTLTLSMTLKLQVQKSDDKMQYDTIILTLFSKDFGAQHNQSMLSGLTPYIEAWEVK